MENPFKPDELVDVVRRVVAEVLGRDPDELGPDDALVDDLGVDSLDFVDITHRIERGLQLTLPKRSFLEHAAAMLPDRAAVVGAQGITPLGSRLLQQGFNQFSPGQVPAGARLPEIAGRASSRNWGALCHQLFNYLPERCPACGSATAAPGERGGAVCAQCAAPLRPLPGDEAIKKALPLLLARELEPQPMRAVG